jgi:hypothetical protein
MPRASKRRPTSPGPPPSVTGAGDVLAGSHMHSYSIERMCIISANTLPADCGGMYSPTEWTIHSYISRTHSSQKPHIGLAYRTGNHLSLRRPTVLQYQVRRPLGACQTGVDQEALRAYPVSGQVEVVQTRHSGAGRPAKPPSLAFGSVPTASIRGRYWRLTSTPRQPGCAASSRSSRSRSSSRGSPGYRGSSCLKEMIRAAHWGATRE